MIIDVPEIINVPTFLHVKGISKDHPSSKRPTLGHQLMALALQSLRALHVQTALHAVPQAPDSAWALCSSLDPIYQIYVDLLDDWKFINLCGSIYPIDQFHVEDDWKNAS